MGKKDKQKKEDKKDDKSESRKDLIKAIDTINSFGVDVVYRGKNGNAFGKKAALDALFPKSKRQQLLDKRDEIDKELSELDDD